jgi:hypothetical protein
LKIPKDKIATVLEAIATEGKLTLLQNLWDILKAADQDGKRFFALFFARPPLSFIAPLLYCDIYYKNTSNCEGRYRSKQERASQNIEAHARVGNRKNQVRGDKRIDRGKTEIYLTYFIRFNRDRLTQPMLDAAQGGHIECIQLLLSTLPDFNLNGSYPKGTNPLKVAYDYGKSKCAKFLIGTKEMRKCGEGKAIVKI